jgi:hypothetical protein
MGHGFDPEWHCTCSVGAEVNPFTFDATAKRRDANLMTREKFEIHYNGRMGDFVGRVFNFSRGERTFDAITHPWLFNTSTTDRNTLVIPNGWEIVGGADTGTYYSALAVAFDPAGDAFVIEEFPNYRYVAGSPERDESVTIPQWASGVAGYFHRHGARANLWADPNSQFKSELRNYDVTLLPQKGKVETRTEVTREYFQHGRIFLAPWVTTLPFEIENAAWPEEATSSGKFARVKDRDHTLDCLEHILSRRPFGKILADSLPKGSFAAAEGWKRLRKGGNIHLGHS